MTESKQLSRVKKWMNRVCIGFSGLFALALLAFVAFWMYQANRFDQAIAQWDQTGEPLIFDGYEVFDTEDQRWLELTQGVIDEGKIEDYQALSEYIVHCQAGTLKPMPTLKIHENVMGGSFAGAQNQFMAQLRKISRQAIDSMQEFEPFSPSWWAMVDLQFKLSDFAAEQNSLMAVLIHISLDNATIEVLADHLTNVIDTEGLQYENLLFLLNDRLNNVLANALRAEAESVFSIHLRHPQNQLDTTLAPRKQINSPGILRGMTLTADLNYLFDLHAAYIANETVDPSLVKPQTGMFDVAMMSPAIEAVPNSWEAAKNNCDLLVTAIKLRLQFHEQNDYPTALPGELQGNYSYQLTDQHLIMTTPSWNQSPDFTLEWSRQ